MPPYPGQGQSYPGQIPPYPGQSQPPYPGQIPPYPGQNQPCYPGQMPSYPSQIPPYPGQNQPCYPGGQMPQYPGGQMPSHPSQMPSYPGQGVPNCYSQNQQQYPPQGAYPAMPNQFDNIQQVNYSQQQTGVNMQQQATTIPLVRAKYILGGAVHRCHHTLRVVEVCLKILQNQMDHVKRDVTLIFLIEVDYYRGHL